MIKIKRNYSFFQHPIKWIKEIRLFIIMNDFANWEWEHGGKERAEQATLNLLLNGTYPREIYKK